MILECTCRHEFQDRMYGRQMRVHNRSDKPGQTNKYRCTVCGNLRTYEQTTAEARAEAKAKKKK